MTRRLSRAFTLVELMVAMALASILIGVISFVFMQSSRIYSETLDSIDATNMVRSSMEILADDLRGIQLPPPSGAIEHLRITQGTGPGPNNLPQDVLEYTTLDRWTGGSPTPIAVTVQIDANGFLTRTGGGNTVNLAPNVQSFQVLYAWPTSPQGSALDWVEPDASGATVPNTTDGTMFVWRGQSAVVSPDSSLTSLGNFWKEDDGIPLEAAASAYLFHGQAGGAYPILSHVMEPNGTDFSHDSVILGGAPPMTADFVIPLLPPKLKIRIMHRTPLGHQVSLERTLAVTR